MLQQGQVTLMEGDNPCALTAPQLFSRLSAQRLHRLVANLRPLQPTPWPWFSMSQLLALYEGGKAPHGHTPTQAVPEEKQPNKNTKVKVVSFAAICVCNATPRSRCKLERNHKSSPHLTYLFL